MKYLVKGYTGPNPDFTAMIDFNGDLRAALANYDRRYNDAWAAVKEELLNSECPTDYLNVFDCCDFDVHEDLAEHDGQVVAHAESYGCDNCQEPDDGTGDNEWTDGCNDEPHGGYMLTFDKMEVA